MACEAINANRGARDRFCSDASLRPDNTDGTPRGIASSSPVKLSQNRDTFDGVQARHGVVAAHLPASFASWAKLPAVVKETIFSLCADADANRLALTNKEKFDLARHMPSLGMQQHALLRPLRGKFNDADFVGVLEKHRAAFRCRQIPLRLPNTMSDEMLVKTDALLVGATQRPFIIFPCWWLPRSVNVPDSIDFSVADCDPTQDPYSWRNLYAPIETAAFRQDPQKLIDALNRYTRPICGFLCYLHTFIWAPLHLVNEFG